METTVREKLLGILEESGLFIDQKSPEGDLDLREYIVDSVQFMSFVVEIENQFDIEIPDEVLAYDNLASLNGFITIVESIWNGSFTAKDESQVETP
ncbi:MAG: acyl carrier protein [Treponema sp.]|jgi:acyl carrier protein|nr:acyl carrier protein [Treponema sp.]